MKKNTTYFARNLRWLRHMNHWTQKEMARLLGIKRTKISSYESGFAEPRLALLCRIADLFEISIERLINADLESESLDIQFVSDRFHSASHTHLENEFENYLDATNKVQKIYDGWRALEELANDNTGAHEISDTDYYSTLSILLEKNWNFIESLQSDSTGYEDHK